MLKIKQTHTQSLDFQLNDSVTGNTLYTVYTCKVDFRLSHTINFTSVQQNKPVRCSELTSYSGLKHRTGFSMVEAMHAFSKVCLCVQNINTLKLTYVYQYGRVGWVFFLAKNCTHVGYLCAYCLFPAPSSMLVWISKDFL